MDEYSVGSFFGPKQIYSLLLAKKTVKLGFKILFCMGPTLETIFVRIFTNHPFLIMCRRMFVGAT